MSKKIRDLGAQDPELKNSPVAWEGEEDTETLRASVPDEPECFFNDRAYPSGTVVKSGSTLLRCDLGLWVPTSDPENP